MQIRRPLCLLSLVFILLATACVYSGQVIEEELSPEGERISLTGIVSDREYRVMFGSRIPVLYISGVKDGNDRQVMCYMTDAGGDDPLPGIGETVRVSGKVSRFREAGNPGEFDLREYYQILNISYKLNQTEILERSGSCSLLKEKLFQIKSRCCEVLEQIYPEKEASVLKAMLLGDKNGLDEEVKELYQLNGLVHILAISGLHVSLLGMGVSGFLKRCRVPVWMRVPAAVGIMCCYGVMTGMGVSTWRAVFMFALHLAAELFGRTYDMLTALSLAAVLMLTGQPLLVRHSGFLLSVGAVLGIGIILPWWREVFGMDIVFPRGRGVPGKLTGWIVEGLYLSSGIAVATLPILFSFYYVFPLYSLLLNLYVIPLMSLVLAFGILSIVGGSLLPEAGFLFGMPDRLILGIYEVSCRAALKLPGGIKIGGKPEPWQIAAYYGILLALILRHAWAEEKAASVSEKERGSSAGICPMGQWLFVLGALWLLLVRPVSGFSVSFLDVGQGDCIVMRNENGNCYMVDGGSTSRSKVGQYQILPFLESMGIGELEAVFVTHPDEDHISGIVELMEQTGYGVRIKSLILPDASDEIKKEKLAELRDQAKENKIPVYYIGRGDEMQDGKLKFTCIGPRKGLATDEVNEISTVLYTEYEEFRMLLTGDVTGEPERELLEELSGRDALTLLKAAHHGSKYSTPRELLELTDPVYAVISAGRDNRYGHPHRELTERLMRQGCHIYQTPEGGAVTVWVKGGRIRVEEFLKGKAGA